MIDAYASQPHYYDHIRPIWDTLPNKGIFTVHPSLKDLRPSDRIGAYPSPDRTPILVAGIPDLNKCASRPVIFVEHGAGQTYTTQHGGYAGGPGRGKVGLFLCPNRQVADANRRSYPRAIAKVVGSPWVEYLMRRRAGRSSVSGMTSSTRPVVALSFHFDCRLWPEAEWAFPYYRDHLTDIMSRLSERYEMLGHGHPRAWPQLERFWSKVGIEPVREFTEIVERADLYVCDNSSTIYEAAACDIPVVLLNQPRYRRNIEIGLRFWALSDIGPHVNQPDGLEAAISEGLADRYRERRSQVTSIVYSCVDGSARRAAEQVAEFCELTNDRSQGRSRRSAP